MSRQVLALSWFGGLLCLGCGGEARDFGQPRQGEGDAGDTTSAVDAGALEAGPTAATTIDADVETTGARSSGQESTAFEDAGGALSTVTSSDDSTGVLPQEPTLDGPCDKGGLRACDVNDSKQTLVCSQGRWQSNGGCAKKFNCDPSEGACSEIIVGCTDATEGARYCRSGDELWECGRNLVSETLVESCEGNCVPDGETARCASPECGDGKVQTDEVCDDGNDDNEDGCTILCKSPECGDGITHSTEACDDGDDDEDDDCTSKCAPPSCGDGLTQSWEVCDDGNTDEDDFCTTACAPPTCGDGIQQSSEQCDDGNLNEDDDCTTLCAPPECGDGIQQAWEACDDGNVDFGDDCPQTCGPEVVEVSSSYFHSCARRADGRVKCWGWNPSGQLGLGSTAIIGNSAYQMGAYLPEVDLGTGRSARQVVTGYGHTCALLDNQHVKCWGQNGSGQLGLGDNLSRGDEPGEMGDYLPEVDLGAGVTVQRLTAGSDHTCALLTGGQVKCWGGGSSGQLGYGDTNYRGDGPDETGDNLPAVDLGLGRTALKLVAGGYHTCALLDDHQLKCWGNNSSGQLGQGHTNALGDAPNELGDALIGIDLGIARFAVDVSAGPQHTCAVLDTGWLKCWGGNDFGQLGQSSNDARGDQPYEMGDNLQPIDLGYGRTALAGGCGQYHTCALLDSHDVRCWGYGIYGVPGGGTTDTWGDQPYELGDYLPVISLGTDLGAQKITSGGYHPCVLLIDGRVKCWGYNYEGELGQGHQEAMGDNPDEMGDNLPFTLLW